MRSPKHQCIIYSAFGDRWRNEAIVSATKIKRDITQDIPLVLHTDQNPPLGDECDIFDKVVVGEKPSGCIFPQDSPETSVNRKNTTNGWNKPYAFKIQGMIDACKELDFEEFLFLDTDTLVMDPQALDIFNLLEVFDIGLAHAPVRIVGHKINSVPDCFPEFNTGVIVFKKTCLPVFERALHLYVTGFIKHPHDQGAFRKALYSSSLRIATLPPEYNHRNPLLKNGLIWHHPEAIKYFKNIEDQS
jgi:hypothetical protein